MTKENDIQKAIVTALKADGLQVLRLNAGKVKVNGGWMQLVPAGTPDLMAMNVETGEVSFIEVKNETGKLRPEQRTFAKDNLKRFTHGVARSVEEAREIIKNRWRGYGYD